MRPAVTVNTRSSRAPRRAEPRRRPAGDATARGAPGVGAAWRGRRVHAARRGTASSPHNSPQIGARGEGRGLGCPEAAILVLAPRLAYARRVPAQRKRPSRQSRVPAGRFERLARFGLLAGEVAIGGLTEAAKRMTGTGTARQQRLRHRHQRAQARRTALEHARRGDEARPVAVARGPGLPAARGRRGAVDPARRGRQHAGGAAAQGAGAQLRQAVGAALPDFGMDPIAAASIGQVHTPSPPTAASWR